MSKNNAVVSYHLHCLRPKRTPLQKLPRNPIKGNVNREGERIYHTPWGDRFYERTRIDGKKGERWFCSEKEATEAGFRASLLR